MRQQQSEEELLFEQVSNKDVEGIIKSLRHDGGKFMMFSIYLANFDDWKKDLSGISIYGVSLFYSFVANPLVLNDDFKTPLEVARTKGYSNVVRAIEVCL